MYLAILACGTVLTFEARSFLPEAGESVPCRYHGYCMVERRARARSHTAGTRGLRRARPRSQRELVEWLRARPETTIHALRRQRFTLRMLAAAERSGVVSVDLDTGRVALR